MVGLTTIGLAVLPVIAALFVVRGDRRTAGTVVLALAASVAITAALLWACDASSSAG